MCMSKHDSHVSRLSGRAITLERLVSFYAVVRYRLRPNNPIFGPFICRHNFLSDPNQHPFPLPGLLMAILFTESPFWEHSLNSQVSILIQGNNRYCSERRAEAIMAAVGILDWYKLDPSDDREDQLVLGMYPLDFVIEAATKMGPQFAMAIKNIASPARSLKYYFRPCRGSMLPFAAMNPARKRGGRDVRHGLVTTDLDKEWNPSFNSWEFLHNGSVLMTKAAILGKKSSGKIEMHAAVKVHLTWLPSGLDSLEVETDVLLQNWLSQQSKYFCTYAIMISRTLGLILQGFRAVGRNGYRRLVKVGCFEVVQVKVTRHTPDATDCDWCLVPRLEPTWMQPIQDVKWKVL